MQEFLKNSGAWASDHAMKLPMPNRDQTPLDALYKEAVDLADRARGWFDGPGIAWRAALPVDAQALVATESLAITARLMAVMSWLLDPAQSDGNPARPFTIAPDGELHPASPLAGTPGGELAMASRQLIAKVAAHSAPDQSETGLWR